VFKKVIGQETSEPQRSAPPAQETRHLDSAPSPSAPSYSSPQPSAVTTRPVAASTRNVLSTDVEIKGIVKFSNDLVVDGKIDGEIHSDGSLTVGENARIKAEIKTATVVVYGKVHGNLTASDRVELKSSAEVIGDIKAKTLSIEAGAIFIGKSTVGNPANLPAAAPKSTAPEVPTQGDLAGTDS
jgi:cytoskeletal protein CcmA (bactofilin family)